MGICYALADDESLTAYDLGKGPWYNWRRNIPTSKQDVFNTIQEWTSGWGVSIPQMQWEIAVIDSIWNYIESHSHCKLIDDCSCDDIWDTQDRLNEYIKEDLENGSSYCNYYLQVASRFDSNILQHWIES